ncbi:MAG: RagB/SusD family nutrient uptake outer membrane protein [Labilibaculum sp.]|nr:RagB/SusD family nutrient uptake outer membrane protein [Labilibaculum sp.]
MKILYIIPIFLLAFVSCEDLNVENLNSPDTETVLSDSDGIESITAGLFKFWFSVGHDASYSFGTETPARAMWYMADCGTVFWSNFGAVDLSMEPREAYINDVTYPYHWVGEAYYKNMYDVLTSSTDVINILDNGMQIGGNGEDTDMVKAVAYFTQGLANGYLGLIFDKSVLISTIDDYETMEFSSYKDVVAKGIEQIEKAIEICENSEFILPTSWIPGDEWSNVELARLAHSYIARLLVYSSRNLTQNSQVDWTKVLEHTEKGIKKDFAPLGDGVAGSWKSYFHMKTAASGWGKIDMRIVNMLDPNIPSTFPESGLYTDLPNNGLAISDDQRLNIDFEYNTENSRPDRGYYRWTTYRYKRLDDYINNNGINKRIIDFRLSENELLMAEAKYNLDDYEGAATLINNGTRITRGGLAAIGNTKEEVWNAIWYERNIELILSGIGIEYFDMRRFDQLQKGTMLHFPVPAQQLQLIPAEIYTYGGEFGVPGEDISIGGWK